MTGALLRMASRWLVKVVAVAGVVSAICFFMVEALPGDMAFQVAAARYDIERVVPATRDAVHEELALENPIMDRLGRWFGTLLHGDLGRSTITKQPVTTMVFEPLVRTLVLVALAWPASIALGLLLGLLLSRSPASLIAAKVLGAIASGTPTYVLGLVLILIVAIQWQLLPAAGYGGIAFAILPAVALALRGAARIALITAVGVADAAKHPSIAFARMKGLPESEVVLGHTLPLASAPIVAFVFVSLAAHLEGIAIIEALFAYPGLGKLLVDSVIARDVPVVQAVAMTLAVMVVSCNALADVAARKLDPRGRA